MPRQDEGQVRVLDVRVGGAQHNYLDDLTLQRVTELIPSGRRVIVVDDTDALEAHHDWYGQLSLGVREAICVAVGPLTAGPSVQLRQSAAVRRPWVTLWVGDEGGVRWAGGSDDGSATQRENVDALRELLAVLASPAVFDTVIRQVGEVPYQTVSPALEAVFPRVDPAELRASHQRALLEITTDVATRAVPLEIELPDPSVPDPAPRAAAQPVAAESPLGQARELVRIRLADARRAIEGLRGVRGLLGSGDGQVPWRAVAAVGHALTEHEQQADKLLSGLERRLAGDASGGERVDAAGVVSPVPDPLDNPALAEGLRAGIDTALRAGHTLPETAAMLRGLARSQAAQILGPARKRLGEVRAESLAARLLAPPDAAMSGGALATIAVAALITCLIVAALPQVGLVVGALLGLAWIAGVVIALRRRPGRTVSAFGLAVRGLMVAAAGAAGVLAGRQLGEFTAAASVALGVELGVAAILLGSCGAAVVWTWNRMLSRWSGSVGLDAVSKANDTLKAIVDDAISGPYRNAPRRARTEEAGGLLATGLTDVNTVFIEWAATSGSVGPAHRQAANTGAVGQLTVMLKGDLGALALAALAGYLEDIASGAVLEVSSTRILDRASELATQYQDYLDAGSIHREPPVAAAPQGRARVTEALWQRSHQSRQLLQGEVRVPMTQLCRREDLRVLDGDWRGIWVVRFAPLEAQRILLGVESDDVVPAEVGAVGLLRLVPLRGGFVHHVVPTSHADDQATGAPVPVTSREVRRS